MRYQAALKSHLGQDKGELPDLAQSQGYQDDDPEGKAHQGYGQAGQGRFEGHHPQGQENDEAGIVDQNADIEQHSNGYEKEAGEYIPQGDDIAEGLMAVGRLGYDQSGQEGSQAQR